VDGELPLNCERLVALLKSEGYPSHLYGIGRRGKYRDQAFILDRWSNRWVVYYIERGEKSYLRKYVSEDAACRDLLSRLSGEGSTLTRCPDGP
jgi:hypothetical protein